MRFRYGLRAFLMEKMNIEGNSFHDIYHYICHSNGEYFDFYQTGSNSIATHSEMFECPTVDLNGRPSHFPMTSTFALSEKSTALFSVPVFQYGVPLGYAAPKKTGSGCPRLRSSSGTMHQTYPLYEYALVYSPEKRASILFALNNGAYHLGRYTRVFDFEACALPANSK